VQMNDAILHDDVVHQEMSPWLSFDFSDELLPMVTPSTLLGSSAFRAAKPWSRLPRVTCRRAPPPRPGPASNARAAFEQLFFQAYRSGSGVPRSAPPDRLLCCSRSLL
jgi:hypothetical protein